jgi:glycosyltransferase involved in cell wall biosynthesis
MKILHISKSLDMGGAAVAAYNIHLSLKSVGVKSNFAVDTSYNTKGKAVNIITPGRLYINKYFSFVRRKLSNFPLIFSSLRKQRSCNIIPTPWPKIINNSDCDIVMIHWVGGGGLSVFDLLKINKKIIWVMHDMWIFCGSEHISREDRYVNGYSKSNKPKNNVLLDVDRYIWTIKNTIIGKIKNITLVAPSEWMHTQAINSKIFCKYAVHTINIPIDIDFWSQSHDSVLTKNKIIKNSNSKFIITFGSSSKSPDKGMQIFIEAIELLPKSLKDNIFLVFFGATDSLRESQLSIPLINYKFIKSRGQLRDIIRVSDICVYPSKVESFGQLAAESIACGTPVIAYKDSGVSDFIINKSNGFLFKKYSASCLMDSIYEAYYYFNNSGVDYGKTISSLSFTSVGQKYDKLIKSI